MLNVINLFGGPGVGKSTIAADVFASLKKEGYDVELITEYAKTRVYEEHDTVFGDQAYMFAKQLRQFHRLEGKVDFAVCESPLLLSVMYAREHNYRYQNFEPFVFEAANHFNNMNFFLARNLETVPYNPSGRRHTVDEARELDKECEKVLKQSGQDYTYVIVDDNVTDTITDLAMSLYVLRGLYGLVNPEPK